jgi:hypothetical protein
MVDVRLDTRAVTGNMQQSSSAFDAWCLALLAWNVTTRVRIDWVEPDPDDPHYQRFLYRLERFAAFLPNRVLVVAPDRLRACAALGSARLVVNRGDAFHAGALGTRSEDKMERGLMDSGTLRDAFGFVTMERQFPVGLFRERKVRGADVFPASRSAIDVVGIDSSDALWIFELKAQPNGGSLGAVSELLFYTHFMRDIMSGRFEMVETGGARAVIDPSAIKAASRIEACLVAPSFHALLDGGRLWDLLNDAAAQLGAKVAFRDIVYDVKHGLLAGER